MSDIVERIRKLRYVHVPVASQLMAEAVAEIERLRNIVSGYTDGISAGDESNQPHEENDEKRGVADTDRATLTEAEREAIEAAIAWMAPVGNYDFRLRTTLQSLLKRME